MNSKTKIKLFEEEIRLIKNSKIRMLVRETIKNVPDYNFTKHCSKKYHPPDERTYLGNTLHTKRVVKWVVLFSEIFDVIMTREELDILIASAIMHDMSRYGFGEQPTETTHPHHSELIIPFIEESAKKVGLSDIYLNKIKSCILFHNGRWTQDNIKKPVKKYTDLEFCLHLADYADAKAFDVYGGIFNANGIGVHTSPSYGEDSLTEERVGERPSEEGRQSQLTFQFS